jgi:aspartyl-tRNA(Asn)/glutamyl-tRNA(Gln) amidotransferase subunit B
MKRKRFIEKYSLPGDDTDFLVEERSTAEWFEHAVDLGGEPRAVCNWLKGDLTKLLHEDSRQIEDSPVGPGQLIEMLGLIEKGTISGKIAKTVFEEMYKTGKSAGTIVEEKGLVQVSDESEIERMVDAVIGKNPGEAERFRSGETKLMGFFVGQIMKETKGKANPKIVNEFLRKKLK